MENFVVDLTPPEEEIRQIVEPLIEGEGFELVKIKVRKAQNKLLISLFIDRKNPPPGVVLDDLTNISLFLGDILPTKEEEHPVLRAQYQLEVSSPGLDRPLLKKSHFEKALGQKIKVRFKIESLGPKRSLEGILTDVVDDGFVIDGEKILFLDISDAHIIYSLPEKGIKKPKNK